MSVCFYPQHEFACPNLSHCPHLVGMALGTLVTDCYIAYFAQVAGAKQKCLVHIARTARDWQKLVEMDSIDYQ